jgi:hypothetical protein
MLDVEAKMMIQESPLIGLLASIFQITFLLAIISCGHVNHNERQAKNISPMPSIEQIEIAELKSYLMRLQSRQLEFDFFGITSNGIDCIYFVPDENKYVIEFEVMTETQKPWLDSLIAFAQRNQFRSVITTYNNKPYYKSNESAPVLRIETKSDLDQTATIGRNIMNEVFRNDDQTVYEVVPWPPKIQTQYVRLCSMLKVK